MKNWAKQIDDLIKRPNYDPQDVTACLVNVFNYEIARDEELEYVLQYVDKLAMYSWNVRDHDLFHEAITTQGRLILRALEEKGLSPLPLINLARRLNTYSMKSSALSLLGAAYSIIKESQHIWSTPEISSLENLYGELLRQNGELGAALEILGHADSQLESLSDQFPLLHSSILNNLGLVLYKLGDIRESQRLLLRSLKLAAENNGDAYSIAITQDNLGSIELELAVQNGPVYLAGGFVNERVTSHLDQAQHYLAEAQKYFEKNLPASAVDYVKSLLNSATHAQHWSNLEAEDYYTRRAYETTRDANIKGLLFWSALSFRSELLLKQGATKAVVQLLTPFINMAASAKHPDEAISEVITDLAVSSALEGEYTLAQEASRLVAAMDVKLLSRKLRATSGNSAGFIFVPFAKRTETILGSAFSTLPDDSCPDWLYEILLNHKGILAERLGSNWIRARASEGASRELIEELKRLSSAAAQLDLDGDGVEFISEARLRHEEAERAIEWVESKILRTTEQEIQLIEWRTADQVRAGMDDDTVLLDFTTMQTLDTTMNYVVFFISRDHPIRVYDLGPVREIDQQITTLLDLLRSQVHGSSKSTDWQTPAKKLSASLFQTGHAVAKKIQVAPSHLWCWVPFALIPDQQGNVLLEKHQISTLPSVRWFVQNHIDRFEDRSVTCNPPLVVGDPDFDLIDLSQTKYFLPMRQERLIHSHREAEEVAALLGVTPRLQQEANRQTILNIHSPEILHLATHGSFLTVIGSQREQSEPRVEVLRSTGSVVTKEYLSLGSDPFGIKHAKTEQKINPLKARHDMRVEWLKEIGPTDPWSRSILLLAGFNAWIAGNETRPEIGSGLLTARELSLLDLIGTKLVVLSSCESGIGPIESADGSLIGLRSAALFAGAASCLSTLWPVDDIATQELVINFYQALKSGHSRAEALQLTQQALRKKYDDPRFWAGWVIEGNTGSMHINIHNLAKT